MSKKFLSLIVFLCLGVSLHAKDNIIVHHAYGNAHQMIAQGRMEKKRAFKPVDKEDGWLRNLWRRAKQVKAGDIKHASVLLSVNHERFTVNGDNEGYFEFDVRTKQLLDMGHQWITLQIKENKDPHKTHATVIDTTPLIGIISDFDDTMIVSEVTDKIHLGINTLFKNYKQRIIVPTILKRFKKILAQNPKGTPSTLFILSGSPQQLFTPIEQFLDYHHFPKHILILKKAHGENKDPLTDQFAYKTQKIERLIQLYPKMRWVMFGDSGEKDAAIYAFIKKRYPTKVKSYYIRNVDNGEFETHK